MISSRGTAALAIAAAVAFAGCGGDDKEPAAEVTTTVLPSTTTTIDPALRDLLLVAADVPMFTEETGAEPKEEKEKTFAVCQPAEAPAANALTVEPEVDGSTFVRGPQGAVKVSSSATATTPEKAEAALTELVDPKLSACYESDLRAAIEKDVPTATELQVKLTATKSEVAGADQAVLLSATIDFTSEGKARDVRSDLVLLRRQGTIVAIFYNGPIDVTSVAERQRIVAAVSKKLGGDTSGSSTTTGGSSTSGTGRGSSTSQRSTSSTGRGSTTSSTRATTSSTR